MIWIYVTTGVFTFLALLCFFTAGHPDDAIIGAAVLGLIAVIFGAIAIAVPLAARHSETVCARQAVDLERDTRFVKYSSFSWDCITPTADGWVSIDRVIKAEGSD